MILWSDPDLFGRRSVIGYRACGLSIREISKDLADETIKRLHYSGSVVWSSSIHFGAFNQSGRLVGVLQFGPGMNPGSGGAVVAGSTPETWLELNRMAFDADRPECAATQAIAGALRIIRHWKPSVDWIQSFADERCGKLGAVYQAASFLYCGSHVGKFVEIDGEVFHQSMISRPLIDKRGWRCGPKVAWAIANRSRANPLEFRQYRYFKPLKKRALTSLKLPILPYPKPDDLSALRRATQKRWQIEQLTLAA